MTSSLIAALDVGGHDARGAESEHIRNGGSGVWVGGEYRTATYRLDSIGLPGFPLGSLDGPAFADGPHRDGFRFRPVMWASNRLIYR